MPIDDRAGRVWSLALVRLLSLLLRLHEIPPQALHYVLPAANWRLQDADQQTSNRIGFGVVGYVKVSDACLSGLLRFSVLAYLLHVIAPLFVCSLYLSGMTSL